MNDWFIEANGPWIFIGMFVIPVIVANAILYGMIGICYINAYIKSRFAKVPVNYTGTNVIPFNKKREE